MRLLVAEDDTDLAEALAALLERNQYSVDTVDNGGDALDYARSGNYDGIILDIMMPVLSGLQVLSKLREEGCSLPIMLLTAKGEKDDRVTGFDAGADDYLPKPFAADELIARLKAILRRSGDYKSTVLKYGDIELDCASGCVSCGASSERLSAREFRVLELFMRSPNAVLSAEKIMDRIWGWDSDAEINVVWVHISNLRKRLKAIGSNVNIRACRGMGYILEVSND